MTKVAVIGCGAIGLTTALEIQQKFGQLVQVTIFAESFSPETTSDIAAGLWTPFCLYNNSEEDVCRWSKLTYDYILSLWKHGKAKETGISLIHTILLSTDQNYVIPKWHEVTLGYESLTKNLLEKLKKQYEQEFTAGFSYIAFTWEASIFLPYFQKEFIRNGGKVVQKRIDDYKELIQYDVIVNCTGLGALTLSKDVNMAPVRGQIIRLKAPWQSTSIYFALDETKSCYIIPNIDSIVIGGTTQKNNFDTKLSSSDRENIISTCSKVVPSLKKAIIVKERVGLRPGRNKVRLEKELINVNGKLLKIVHNYGHGGAGITLCIGCAEDACKLVMDMILIGKSKY